MPGSNIEKNQSSHQPTAVIENPTTHVENMIEDAINSFTEFTKEQQNQVLLILCTVHKRADFDQIKSFVTAFNEIICLDEGIFNAIISLNEKSFGEQAERENLPYELDSNLPDLLEIMLYNWYSESKSPTSKRSEGSIDTGLLQGLSIRDKLLHYCKRHADPLTAIFVALSESEPCATDKQRGETCKLAALAHAIEHATYDTEHIRPTLYKNGDPNKVSIRQLAKKHGSQIGEIYSMTDLLQICEDTRYDATYYAPDDEDIYIRQLQILVEKELTPVVFFDIELEADQRKRCGFPKIGTGKNEHAAIVVGYYIDKDGDTHFIVSHWGEFFDFDGMELALSSCRSLIEKRAPETFCKVEWMGEKLWVTKGLVDKENIIIIAQRAARPLREDHIPLKGKILAVERPKSSRMLPFFQKDSDTKDVSSNHDISTVTSSPN